MITEQQRTLARAIRASMTTASDYITDPAQASTVPDIYPLWARADWRDYKLGTIRRHKDKLWRFCQPALTNETQNVEPGTDEAIWTEIAYHDGVRIIPDPITSTKAFALDELGWWPEDGNVYRSKMAGNTHQPNVVNPPWDLVSGASGGTTPEQPTEQEPTAPEGSRENPIQFPETGLADVTKGLYYLYKGKLYLALKDAPKTNWKPTDPGTYIWELAA